MKKCLDYGSDSYWTRGKTSPLPPSSPNIIPPSYDVNGGFSCLVFPLIGMGDFGACGSKKIWAFCHFVSLSFPLSVFVSLCLFVFLYYYLFIFVHLCSSLYIFGQLWSPLFFHFVPFLGVVELCISTGLGGIMGWPGHHQKLVF